MDFAISTWETYIFNSSYSILISITLSSQALPSIALFSLVTLLLETLFFNFAPNNLMQNIILTTVKP